MTRTVAVLTQKNEGAFLLEWLAHHKATGFSDFVVLSNDCEDGSDLMLDRLQDLGHLSHIRNDGPYDERGIQFTALKLADTHPTVQQADWIISMDIDEFVNVHVGDRTLNALFQAAPSATAIALTWRLFGNNGAYEYKDRFVTERFTRAAPKTMAWPWRAFMIKTLYKNDGTYGKIGVHRQRNPDKSKLGQSHWINGSGVALDDSFKLKRLFADYSTDTYHLVQMNHYALGDMQSFIVKCNRGRSGTSYQPLGMEYWTERNFVQEEDRSILHLNSATRKIFDDLLQDEILFKLHENAVEWRHKKFQQLMQHEPMRALLGRMMMTPPSQPISVDHANILRNYAQIALKRQN